MSLVLSVIFWAFLVVASAVAVIIAVYMVLGLLLVDGLHNSDSEYHTLQLQTRFLTDGVSTPISFDFEASGVFGVPQSSSKPNSPSGCRESVAATGANKQQITLKVYGGAVQ